MDYRQYVYDGLGRNVGFNKYGCTGGGCGPELNSNCHYDPLSRMITPCEDVAPNLGFDGENVVRTGSDNSPSDWTFIHGPGTDDPVLGRYTGTNLVTYFVTDGQGRQYAAVDKNGVSVTGLVAYSQQGGKYAGGTASGASFDADRHGSSNVPGLSFFRNRVYDQATGRWTQEDPIGVAGGVNLYQFNGNNPVSLSDPLGLKVCFRGNSAAERGELRIATEAATGSRITLDKDDCVSSVKSDGRKGFSKILSRFQALVSSEYEVAVRFAKEGEGSRFDPDNKDAVISRDDATRGTYGTCVGIIGMILGQPISAPFTAASIVAHELIGHGGGIVTAGIPSPQSTAVAFENQYHQAASEPQRCIR